MKNPRIITVCGSTRFIETIAIMQWQLEKIGYIVLGMHLLPAGYRFGKNNDHPVHKDHQAEAEGKKKHMDDLHLRKIDLSEAIFVVNVGGYIGESTKREIAYAKKTKKTIIYMEDSNGKSQPLSSPG